MDFKAQVLALREAGHGFKTIARSLSASKNTIKRICEEAAAPAAPLPTSPSTPSPPWADKIDWKEVVREVRAGVTLKQLFKEHAPEVGYTGFRRQVRKLAADTPRASIPLTHVPGEKVQVDYTKGVELEPGSERSVRRGTELFVGVLPHSGKIFARFFLDQKLPSFIAAHEAMFAFFGGVTPYVVIDNLKAGVSKAHRYDPDENKTYCDFGNHMGFAVLPCRPATPRDKGAVENAIGIIQRTFYHEVRNRRFDSLHALNSALGEFLVRLNAEVMKDYGVSRDERFLREAPSLRPLPADPFELAEWREAKVHPDCEIQVDKNFYSVPYTLVGRSVRVKLGRNIVEVFDLELGRVTRHARLRGIGQHSRYDWHYPSERLQQARYEIRNAKDDADRVGPQTRAVIEVLFAGQWPLRGLRRAQGVLRCARAYGNDALEHACGKALHFKKYRVDFIKDCAMTFHRGQEEFRHGATPMRDEATLFLHSEYARTLQ
jgi:transposase